MDESSVQSTIVPAQDHYYNDNLNEELTLEDITKEDVVAALRNGTMAIWLLDESDHRLWLSNLLRLHNFSEGFRSWLLLFLYLFDKRWLPWFLPAWVRPGQLDDICQPSNPSFCQLCHPPPPLWNASCFKARMCDCEAKKPTAP